MKHAQSPEELGTEAGKKTTETMGALANALHNAGMIVTKEGETILAVFDTGLFTSGTALSPQGEAQLSKVGRLLKPHDRFLIVRISGCTDDIPVRPGSVYYDNIALGYARAVAAAEYLRRGPSLPANMFVILSPDNAPLFPNDSSVNRRKNRTVKLCISFAEPSAL
jgi:chemotaxis protein MotB